MRILSSVTLVFVIAIMLPGALAVSQSQQRGSPTPAGVDEPVLIHDGFITGQRFRELSELSRRSYAAGLVDGMLLAPFVGAPKARLQWFETCATGMTDGQVAATISKFVNENPARWHEQVHAQFYAAMRQACPQAQ